MAADLSSFLTPRSVTVIGASRSPEKVGAIVLKNLLDFHFPGHIYPVNPQTDSLQNLPCFKSVANLPEVPDLAIVALPAAAVIDTLTQIGTKGISNVVVFSAGFKEIGPDGARLEQQLTDIAARYHLRLLGPNCLGFINESASLNATFALSAHQSGNLRFISQSGAIAAALFDWCQSVGLGFSQFITLGNKPVLNENDFLTAFAAASLPPPAPGLSSVSPIGLYLESISDGPEFVRLTTQISRTQPIFIIKPGKTPAAAAAMQSHTGAIAGADDILDTALAQAHVERCATLEDFFDLSRALAWENAPAGPRVAVISNAGGPAVLTADAIASSGLKLAELDAATKEKLQSVLPRSASIRNPIDVLGDALADRYAAAADTVLATGQADALLVILTPQVMTQVDRTAQLISDLSRKYPQPIFCSFIGGRLVHEGERILNQNLIPSFRFPERAVAAISAMWHWQSTRTAPAAISGSGPASPAEAEGASPDSTRIHQIVTAAEDSHHPALDNLETNEIMSLLGLPTPPTAAVPTLESAHQFATQTGWPVVLKLSSPGLLHKAHMGGVITGINNASQLELAWDRLNHAAAQLPPAAHDHLRYQIQKEATSGIEVIVGLRVDPTFGPVLLFGAGGQLAELVADKNLKILPVSRDQVKDLVSKSKVFRLLQPQPGEPEYALDQLYDLIVNLTRLIPLLPQASDIEVNPVIVTHNHVWAVDAKILLTGIASRPAVSPQFHTAVLTDHTPLAGKFHYFEFTTPEPFVSRPGQYVSVKVAPDRINSYSIADRPADNKFTLLVDTAPGGPGSKFFDNLQPQDKVAFLGPFGVFTLQPDDGAQRILFLGTGSGCSPLRSILEAALKHPDLKVPIDFYFGLRHTDDVFWQDYFQKLSVDHPNFHFNFVLSQPDAAWHGQAGHITELLEKEVPDATHCSAYLCGNPKMIDEATQILLSRNCPEGRIYTEKF